mmetsp:Transcript_12636/g.27354  ORF Transcript_12636/g.27354 Transcript_12636/m.27354 type:complete len:123 (+) Transcript_12636:430-798(+)
MLPPLQDLVWAARRVLTTLPLLRLNLPACPDPLRRKTWSLILPPIRFKTLLWSLLYLFCSMLDVYADWCGPCKALAPALEQMAVKAGGMFRLVKLNSDNERSASQALEVKALPTVFGIRDAS